MRENKAACLTLTRLYHYDKVRVILTPDVTETDILDGVREVTLDEVRTNPEMKEIRNEIFM